MFGGITEYAGVVRTHDRSSGRLVIGAGSGFAAVEAGASVCINGVCLTAVAIAGSQTSDTTELHFDVSPETYQRSNLGELELGDRTNIEPSLKFGDELGGHLVSGHVHGQVVLQERNSVGENGAFADMLFTGADTRYLVEKGFVALDGASITVGELTDDGFWVHIIPETLERSRIGALQIGDKVNIEYEQNTVTVVDSVERYLAQRNLEG